MKENVNDTWKQTGRRSKGEVCSEKENPQINVKLVCHLNWTCLGECVQDNYGDFSPKLI